MSAAVKRSHHASTGVGPNLVVFNSNKVARTQSPTRTPSSTSTSEVNAVDINSPRTRNINPTTKCFEPSASIVLIGIRGVGKTTLGVLAATAYNRRLIDTERAFLEATEVTTTAYRKRNGTVEYQRRHSQILERTLKDHSFGTVIVCSFSDLEGNGASIVKEYSRSHPVIQVTRDLEGTRSHLRGWPIDKIRPLLLASSSRLRTCSNYEFFNLSETQYSPGVGSLTVPGDESKAGELFDGNFLTLKRVERDFLRVLRNIIGDYERGLAHHSAYPLSQLNVEQRTYTFAVKIGLFEVISQTVDLDQLQIGADCIELAVVVADLAAPLYFDNLSLALATIRRATLLPILLSVVQDAQSPRGNHAALLETTYRCLRLAPELCTIDLTLDDPQVLQLVECKGRSRTMGVLKMLERPIEGWRSTRCVEAYKRAVRLGCDVVKITMPASSVDDTSAIYALQSSVEDLGQSPKLVAYSTGSYGKTSRCFNKTLTPVERTTCSEPSDDPATEGTGTLSARAITEALFACFVFEPMRFCIFGGDVSYSLSPAMHNAAYEACGMQYTYEARSSVDLDGFHQLSRAYDFGGAAFTQPFKTIAIPLMDGLSPQAKAIGAVNTIVPVREVFHDGSIPKELSIIDRCRRRGPVKALYGFNTDWIGIRACIRRGLSPANTVRPQSSAVVCGAGGMARAAVYSLISLGIRNIFVCNRTYSNATALAEHYNDLISARDIPELSSEVSCQPCVRVVESFTSNWPTDTRQPTVVVSCIPRQAVDEPPTGFLLPEAWLKSPTGGVVLEVAYRRTASLIGPQIRERAQAGWIFMDGFDVLPEQAFSQFELFTGRRAPRKLMRDEIAKLAQR